MDQLEWSQAFHYAVMGAGFAVGTVISYLSVMGIRGVGKLLFSFAVRRSLKNLKGRGAAVGVPTLLKGGKE